MSAAGQHNARRTLIVGICVTMGMIAAAALVPVIGVVALPLPGMVCRLKLGPRQGGLVPAVAFVLMAAIAGGGVLDRVVVLGLLLLGYLLGEGIARGFSIEKTVGLATGSLAVLGTVALYLTALWSDTAVAAMVRSSVAEHLAVYAAALTKLGAAEETRQAFLAAAPRIETMVVRMLPGAVLSGILTVAWLALLMARPVFRRAGIARPAFGALIHWRCPEGLVWGVITGGALLLLPAAGAKAIGLNLLMVLLQIYFFQGIAIVSFYFETRNVPPMVRWVLYALIPLQIYVLLLVIGLGFFDMWLNVRKLTADGGGGS